MPWAARSKSPPLFTTSNPTPCFFWGRPPHLRSLTVGLPGPSRGHRSLPRAMENFYDSLTFIQLFGSEEGARRRAQTCLCINSGDRAGGWSHRCRVAAGALPTEPGVPSPAGTQAQCPRLGDPEPAPRGRKYFGFVQKNNNTKKKKEINPPPPSPSHPMAARDVLAHKQGVWGWRWPGQGRGTAPTPPRGDGLGSAGDTAMPCARDEPR